MGDPTSLVSKSIKIYLEREARDYSVEFFAKAGTAPSDLLNRQTLLNIMKRYFLIQKFLKWQNFSTMQILSPQGYMAARTNPLARWLETRRENPATYPFWSASSRVSSSWQTLRDLPSEVSLKIIEHALKLSFTNSEHIAVLLLSVLLNGAKLSSIDFASRVGPIRSPRLAPINPSSWTILGYTMPSSITRINLNHLNVEDSFLAALALSPASNSLKKLKLRQNSITLDGLSKLNALKSLQTLDVAMIPFPPGAVAQISRACPSLQVLYIGKIDGFASLFIKELNQKCGDGISLPHLRKLEILGDQQRLAADVAEIEKFMSQRHHLVDSPFEISPTAFGKICERLAHTSLRLRSDVKRLPQQSGLTPRELVQFGTDPSGVGAPNRTGATSNLRHLTIRNDPSVHLRVNKMIDYPVLSIESPMLVGKFPLLRTLQLSRVVCANLDLSEMSYLHTLKMDHIMFEKISFPASISNVDFETLRSVSLSALVDGFSTWQQEFPHSNLNSISASACVVPWRVLRALMDTLIGRIRNLALSNLSLPDSEISDPFSSASSFSDSDDLSGSEDSVAKEAASPIPISLRGGIQSLIISTEREYPRFRLDTSDSDGSLSYLNVPSDLIDAAVADSWPWRSQLATFHLTQKRYSDHEPDFSAIKRIIAKSPSISSLCLPPILQWNEPTLDLAPVASRLRRLQLTGPSITDFFLQRIVLILPNLVELILGNCRSVTDLSWLVHKSLSECRIRGLQCADMKEFRLTGSEVPEMRTLEVSFRSAKRVIIRDLPNLTKLALHGSVSRSVIISGCRKLSDLAISASLATKHAISDTPNIGSLHLKVPTKSSGGSISINSKLDKMTYLSLDVASPIDNQAIKLLDLVGSGLSNKSSPLQAVTLSAALDDDTDDDDNDEAYEYAGDKDAWRAWTKRALAALSGRCPTVWDNFPALHRVEVPFKTLDRVK